MSKYIAIPKLNINLIEHTSYNVVLEAAKKSLEKNPDIVEYKIVELISKVTSVTKIGVICYNRQYLEDPKNDQAVEAPCFDDMPFNIPKPPDGYVYFGLKPIYEDDSRGSLISIAVLDGSSEACWFNCAMGSDTETHYAVKIGTQTYQDAIKAHTQGSPV